MKPYSIALLLAAAMAVPATAQQVPFPKITAEVTPAATGLDYEAIEESTAWKVELKGVEPSTS